MPSANFRSTGEILIGACASDWPRSATRIKSAKKVRFISSPDAFVVNEEFTKSVRNRLVTQGRDSWFRQLPTIAILFLSAVATISSRSKTSVLPAVTDRQVAP